MRQALFTNEEIGVWKGHLTYPVKHRQSDSKTLALNSYTVLLSNKLRQLIKCITYLIRKAKSLVYLKLAK